MTCCTGRRAAPVRSIKPLALALMLALAPTASWGQAPPGVVASFGVQLTSPQSYESIPRFISREPGFVVPSSSMLNNVPAPGNQGATGTCVGWAVAGAKTILEARLANADPNSATVRISPAHIYVGARRDLNCQAGLVVATALNFVLTQGAATLSEMPFSDSNGLICRFFNENIRQAALKRKTENWGRITDYQQLAAAEVADIKYVIARGNPVIMAVQVDTNLVNWWGRKDVMETPGPFVTPPSYHAMLIVGYDDQRKAFKVMNSWSEAFGDSGFYWLGYGAAQKVVREAYTIQER